MCSFTVWCKSCFFNEDLTYHSEHKTLIGIECINNLNYSNLEDEDGNTTIVEFVKPYLFPMDSLPEEKVHEFYCRFVNSDIPFDDFVADYWPNSLHKVVTVIDDVESIMDWYNENHVDCRGMIYRDLAIDATGLNIY